jgi:exopolysaccharide production protein ExoQ
VNPSLASLICWCGVAGLFYLDRDKTVRTSKALWLPVIYLLLIGSRPASVWLGIAPPAGTNVQLDGSPFDATIFGILLLATVVVLVRRGRRVLPFLRANWLILAYFGYCLISVLWSFHPDVAFKRWLKAIGDPAMCLVVVTDLQPIDALKRLISRVGFVLLPCSVLLIKYYPALGRAYGPGGEPSNTGVATDKNMLGVMLFVISLSTLWHVLTLLREKRRPNRKRHLVAQGTLLAFGVVLFGMANSQTSTACFILGGGLLVATRLRTIRRRPAMVHILCFTIFLAGGLLLLLGGGSEVVQALGRKSNLSGRTDIWAALIPAAANPVVGAGFESFWISPNAEIARHTLKVKGWWDSEGLIEAHDGYLEAYLNLGFLGLCLILLILTGGYRQAVAGFRRSPSMSGLLLAFVVCSAFYNITESGFRMLGLPWLFLLLSVFCASGIALGRFVDGAAGVFSSPPRLNGRTSSANDVEPVGASVALNLHELDPLPFGWAKWGAPNGR